MCWPPESRDRRAGRVVRALFLVPGEDQSALVRGEAGVPAGVCAEAEGKMGAVEVDWGLCGHLS